ncbi:zinc-ribbon domain-containing protein [Clostridium sp. P21]|uniref:Membrane-associated protein TcaA n=1 Tax=Clostridium muellerianum TaxID=2716538 RepID=A0A7Y0HPM2_9CLOT|nr:zinc-ribbon domain-containing protein [Clostridium muellerianum]NMM63166.1 zinc-ribbon domain-containing protein [Clostridium muellerianum]
MSFCGKCGAKLEEGQKFCPKCGNVLNTKQNESHQNFKNNNEYTYEDEIRVPSNEIRRDLKMSRKTQIGIMAAAIVAVLLIGFYIVGNSLTKPSKVVSKFENAVASGNKADLISTLYCDDNRLEINEKTIVPLLTYFKDNPSYLNTVVQGLNKDAVNASQTKALSRMNGGNSKAILTLAYSGKKFLFFPDYRIAIKPGFIQVKTSVKDVAFSLNGTDIGKSDSDNFSKEFGPFIPGKYSLLANYKGKYASLSDSHDINFFDNSSDKITVETFTNVNYVNVKSDYPDAKIFVNGKDTGVKVSDAGNFGPLNSNTKIYGMITKDGKVLKSSEETVDKGDKEVYLSFSQAESSIKSQENQIHNLVYWYTYYFTRAVNSNSFTLLEDLLYPGSQIYNEQKSYVPSTYKSGIREEIKSFNITSYKLSEDNKSGTINTEEVYDINDNGTSSIKTFKYTYTFRYNEAKNGYQMESLKAIE